MLKDTYLYCLLDPRTYTFRYVGITYYPGLRYQKHLSCSRNRYKSNWIKKLASLGLQPRMVLIRKCTRLEAFRLEKEWIEDLRIHYGKLLTNMTKGGEGSSLLNEEDEYRRIAAIKKGIVPGQRSETQRQVMQNQKLRDNLRTLFSGRKRAAPGRTRPCKSSEGIHFSTVKEASEYYELHPNTVTWSLTHKETVKCGNKDIQFWYLNDEHIVRPSKERPVISSDGLLFPSIKKAAEHYELYWGTIKYALNNDKAVKGVSFKYAPPSN